eukprot:2586615-Alexandrium_andersonii.AAC.1
MSASLVGSEMCIRDRPKLLGSLCVPSARCVRLFGRVGPVCCVRLLMACSQGSARAIFVGGGGGGCG